MTPRLIPMANDGVRWYEDDELRSTAGILVAFSTREGGASEGPYSSLNLAGHVGDDPARVDENRGRLFNALGEPRLSPRLVTAEQVHGDRIVWAVDADAGRGARVLGGLSPMDGTDALATNATALPLMLLYADCVPVVLADPVHRSVAVVHAGWRGALAGLPGAAVGSMIERGSTAGDLRAYVGAHICAHHYEVGETLVSHFVNRFGTVAEAQPGHLDLGAVVSADLSSSGVCVSNICRIGACTAEATDRFYSYRASSGVAGRHAALAVVLG